MQPRAGQRLGRIEMIALGRIQRGVEGVELGDQRAHRRRARIAFADDVVLA